VRGGSRSERTSPCLFLRGSSAAGATVQPWELWAIAEQVAAGEPGIIGVMLESFLEDGRQDLTDRTRLTAGQSITDECMGWEMTVPVLRELASAVRARRALRANQEH
jgi:3-deoxy-7-phosphoheptulonate synthase